MHARPLSNTVYHITRYRRYIVRKYWAGDASAKPYGFVREQALSRRITNRKYLPVAALDAPGVLDAAAARRGSEAAKTTAA